MGGGGKVGMIGSAIGTGMSMLSKKKAADAAEDQASDQAAEKARVARQNKELAYEDASLAEEEAYKIEMSTAYAIKQRNELADRSLGSQITRFAKSNVVVGTGTPTETMARSQKNLAQDIQMVKYNGKTAADQKRDLAKRFRRMGDQGLSTAAYQGQLLEEVAADEAKTLKFSAMTDAASMIGKFMSDKYSTSEG